MSIFTSRWFHILEIFAPAFIALAVPGGAVFGPLVSAAISEAEQIQGATGADKKTHVLGVVTAGINLLNTVKGSKVVDSAATTAAVSSAIDTTIAVVNLIHSTQEAAK